MCKKVNLILTFFFLDKDFGILFYFEKEDFGTVCYAYFHRKFFFFLDKNRKF